MNELAGNNPLHARKILSLSLATVTAITMCTPSTLQAASVDVVKPAVANACNGIGSGGVGFNSIRYTNSDPKITPPSSIVAQFGNTQEAISKNFAAVMEANFDNVSAEQILDRLSDEELASIAARYQISAGSSNTKLLSIFAAKLSDQALLRVASAFGTDAVKQAVIEKASPAVKASFLAKISEVVPLTVAPAMLPPPGQGNIGGGGPAEPPAGAPPSSGGITLPPPAPPSTDWSNTLEEIYLDYRTSPTLNMGVADSLSATSIYTYIAVQGSWDAGTYVGTGISNLITKYDPDLSDAIGGTIAGMVSNANQAMNELQTGQFQSAVDVLFGYPITNSTNPSGPDNLTAPMVYYYNVEGPPANDPGYSGSGGDQNCQK
jgi:hypothetical protein